MLSIELQVELTADKSRAISFMMKIQHEGEMFRQFMQMHNLFVVEEQMYNSIVPEFEALYKAQGVDIKFGAESYKLKCPPGEFCILLEDLRTRGFKNANRLEGLDMEHTKCVLRKMAQWHAASVLRIQTKGKYNDKLVSGFLQEHLKPMVQQMNDDLGKVFLQCLPLFAEHEKYQPKIQKLLLQYTDELFKYIRPDANEFNVLNHGDCWNNNVMFQYDAFGKIKDTYFVDYQIPKYGSPAQDLLYFLLSSTKLELKTTQFDYFIKFYYDNLIENLKLLKYGKKMPTLADIHTALYKYGLWAYATVTGVMAAVLLDPPDKETFNDFLNDSGADLKIRMFSGERYRKHIEVLLPWLDNRGAMDC